MASEIAPNPERQYQILVENAILSGDLDASWGHRLLFPGDVATFESMALREAYEDSKIRVAEKVKTIVSSSILKGAA